MIGQPTRRLVLAGFAATVAAALRPAFAREDFAAFLQSMWPDAQAKGVRRSTFLAAVSGLTLDRGLPKTSGGQPEFDKPLQAYFRSAVSSARIAQGRLLMQQTAGALTAIESRFGIPGEICVAAWGMESDYGRSRGNRDVVRTLASLAYTRADRPIFRDEFVAALVILDRGDVDRGRLSGSWAGAMGDPQFLPSAYLKYAVSASGPTRAPDIWTDPSDILASVANFLRSEGWAAGQPWIDEVQLPPGFGFPTLHGTTSEWTALGLRRSDGQALAGDGEAALFVPSGAAGPAFLLFPNYFVIKQYNNSDSYALSLGFLAQRIAGSAPLKAPWPERPINLSRTDKLLIQAKLAALGLYDGPRDGKFGPKVRDAIHAYQRQAGLSPADGFATAGLAESLKRDRH